MSNLINDLMKLDLNKFNGKGLEGMMGGFTCKNSPGGR